MAIRETWPCDDCGHKHYASQACADHQWTDACPYEGLKCPPDVAKRKAKRDAEIRAKHGPNPSLFDIAPPVED